MLRDRLSSACLLTRSISLLRRSPRWCARGFIRIFQQVVRSRWSGFATPSRWLRVGMCLSQLDDVGLAPYTRSDEELIAAVRSVRPPAGGPAVFHGEHAIELIGSVEQAVGKWSEWWASARPCQYIRDER